MTCGSGEALTLHMKEYVYLTDKILIAFYMFDRVYGCGLYLCAERDSPYLSCRVRHGLGVAFILLFGMGSVIFDWAHL